MLGQVDVFWVVKVGIRGVEDGVDDAGLQVQQHSPGDVVLIICLQREQEDLDAAAARCHFHCESRSYPLAAGEPHMAGVARGRREGERLVLCSPSSRQRLCAPEHSQRGRGGLFVLT